MNRVPYITPTTIACAFLIVLLIYFCGWFYGFLMFCALMAKLEPPPVRKRNR